MMIKQTPSSDPTQVNYKSPKNDIWQAYKSVVSTLSQDDPSAGSVKQAVAKLPAQSPKLKKQFQQVADDLYQNLNKSLADLLGQFEQASLVLEQLHTVKEKQQTELSQEKARLLEDLKETRENNLKLRQREAEEYEYDFKKRQERLEIGLKELREKTEAKLSQREMELKTKEDELNTLRQQAKAFEEKIALAVKQAVAENTQQLELVYNHSTALAEQKYQSEIKMNQQKINDLNASIKQQQQESQRLQAASASMSAKLTMIAEKAVTRTNATRDQQTVDN